MRTENPSFGSDPGARASAPTLRELRDVEEVVNTLRAILKFLDGLGSEEAAIHVSHCIDLLKAESDGKVEAKMDP